MAILYSPTQIQASSVSMLLVGDGSSTSFSIDLERAPFKFQFSTDIPFNSLLNVNVSSFMGPATPNISGSKITFTLPSAPAAGAQGTLSFDIAFAG